jgi:hypothetical protein
MGCNQSLLRRNNISAHQYPKEIVIALESGDYIASDIWSIASPRMCCPRAYEPLLALRRLWRDSSHVRIAIVRDGTPRTRVTITSIDMLGIFDSDFNRQVVG